MKFYLLRHWVALLPPSPVYLLAVVFVAEKRRAHLLEVRQPPLPKVVALRPSVPPFLPSLFLVLRLLVRAERVPQLMEPVALLVVRPRTRVREPRSLLYVPPLLVPWPVVPMRP